MAARTEIRRQEVLDVLRKAGMSEAAERVESSLPDKLSYDDCAQLLSAYGITKDFLISRLGGSP